MVKVASKNIQQKNLVGLQNQAHRIAFQYCGAPVFNLFARTKSRIFAALCVIIKSLSKNISFPSKGSLGPYFLTRSE